MSDKIQNLYDELDAGLDADEYARLDRTAPWLTGAIRKLVKAGQTPDEITAHLLVKRPYQWMRTNEIKAAARFVVREMG